ncbi:MAG: hypothetical protein RL477_2085 [Pseudomonadota bacterium]|jgi:DNA-binding transcriptional MerR regulator
MSEILQSDPPRPAPAARRNGGKSASAFRTISEVARELDVPQHVLRFWESKFGQVKPLKRGGGRRYYRPEDVELLKNIRTLLYRDGYTIKGVQKLMREGNVLREAETETGAEEPQGLEPATVAGVGIQTGPSGLSARQRSEIEAVIQELTDIRRLLND